MLYFIGLVIAVQRRKRQPWFLSFWAIGCYGLLIVLGLLKMWQVGTIINAHELGVWKSEPRWFDILGYVRTALLYVCNIVLMIVALLWRKGSDDGRPLTFVLIAAALFIAGTLMGRLGISGPVAMLNFLIDLGATTTLIIAVYGWRRE